MMKLSERFTFVGEDPRVRKWILPRRVVTHSGAVEGADNLFLKKHLQIGFSPENLTVLRNQEGREHSSLLLDFGCEFHGGIRILTSAIAGNQILKVRLTFGESVGEAMSVLGGKHACNDHSPRDFEVSVPQWSDLEFGQTGFRFVRIELLNDAAVWNIKAILGVFVYREIEYIGSFACDDPRLNEIFDTSAYTCHLNMQTMLWDGIKRDRLVWVGDTHPEMLAIRSLFGSHPIVEENLRFSRDEAPLPGWMNRMPSYSLWWLILLHDWCRATGNFSVAAESREYVCGLLKRLLDLIDENGSYQLPDYFLDWNTRGKAEAKAGVHALFYLAIQAGESLCAADSEPGLMALCRQKKLLLAQNIPFSGDSTEANALLLYAGLGDPEQETRVILSNGAAGMSTLLSYYILTAIAANGHLPEALNMLKDYYGGMLDMGATTFWENFHPQWAVNSSRLDVLPEAGKQDIHGDFGEHCYKGYRHSLCHGWSAGPVPFLLEQVLGIRVTGDAGKAIHLCPDLGYLQFAKGSYPTAYGKLEVAFRRDGENVVLESLKVPDGCLVTVDEKIKRS